MNLDKKLDGWVAAGLIDQPTSARIAEFEAKRAQPLLLYAIGGLGALTIGIGIVSIVAANWAEIGRTAKLGLDLVLGACLAAGLYRVAAQGRAWQTDVLAAIYWAYALASIALLGQVYQLGSPEYQALLVWTACTAPMMLLARSRLVGMAWLCGIVGTHVTCLAFLFDALDDRPDITDAFLANLAAVVVLGSFVLYAGLARLPWFVRERPMISVAWSEALWSGLLVAGLALCFAWYERAADDFRLTWALGVCALVAAAFAFFVPRLYPNLNARTHAGMRALLAATWLVLISATGFDRLELAAVGAISQVALLSIAAWTVLQTGRVRMFNSLTGLITLRILVMYFEVFGSMLDTGLGMIGGGILTLLLAWVWKRKSPELASRLVAHAEARHGA